MQSTSLRGVPGGENVPKGDSAAALLQVEQAMFKPECVLGTGSRDCGQLASSSGGLHEITDYDGESSACVAGGKENGWMRCEVLRFTGGIFSAKAL